MQVQYMWCSRLVLTMVLTLCCLFLLPALNIRTFYEPGFTDPELKELRVAPKPVLNSRSSIVFEESTGTILFQNNIDMPIPPASLTKLVVMALALDFIQKKQISLDMVVEFSEKAWAKNAPVRSSLMFLGPNQTCTWQDLLMGLAVDSGNDAAIAIAEQVDGSEEAFIAHMNHWCAALGLKATHFIDSSGYDAKNITTARDYAYLVWNYLRIFPQAVALYHSVKEFTYPHDTAGKPIRQFNRNKLLFAYPGADGLKTGFIDESGYNLAFTASRNSMRVAGILLGAISEEKRFTDARTLLNYCFDEYQVVSMSYSAPQPIRIWNGSQPLLYLLPGKVDAVLPRTIRNTLKAHIEQKRELSGPIASTDAVAWAVFSTTDGQAILRYPLECGLTIEEANLIVQGAEAMYLSFRGLFGVSQPRKISTRKQE